ncbi:c-type cytochrome [Paenibacillus solani]|uniref:c-type cytochrome n=1 Tax=Paenibacillus solani TaxID=1705565 RepID=UPI003D2B4B59
MIKKSLLIMMLLAAFVMVVSACGGGNKTSEPAPAPSGNEAPAGNEGETGGNATEATSLYNANCMACHATDLSGGGSFPNLQKVGSKYDASQIAGIITNGRNGMPSFQGKLTDAEITTLSEWLAAKK